MKLSRRDGQCGGGSFYGTGSIIHELGCKERETPKCPRTTHWRVSNKLHQKRCVRKHGDAVSKPLPRPRGPRFALSQPPSHLTHLPRNSCYSTFAIGFPHLLFFPPSTFAFPFPQFIIYHSLRISASLSLRCPNTQIIPILTECSSVRDLVRPVVVLLAVPDVAVARTLLAVALAAVTITVAVIAVRDLP